MVLPVIVSAITYNGWALIRIFKDRLRRGGLGGKAENSIISIYATLDYSNGMFLWGTIRWHYGAGAPGGSASDHRPARVQKRIKNVQIPFSKQ
jgi:hypothetical protein